MKAKELLFYVHSEIDLKIGRGWSPLRIVATSFRLYQYWSTLCLQMTRAKALATPEVIMLYAGVTSCLLHLSGFAQRFKRYSDAQGPHMHVTINQCGGCWERRRAYSCPWIADWFSRVGSQTTPKCYNALVLSTQGWASYKSSPWTTVDPSLSASCVTRGSSTTPNSSDISLSTSANVHTRAANAGRPSVTHPF